MDVGVDARSILAPGPWSDAGPVRLLSDGKRKRQEACQQGLFKGGCSSEVVPCPLAESQQRHMVPLLVSQAPLPSTPDDGHLSLA